MNSFIPYLEAADHAFFIKMPQAHQDSSQAGASVFPAVTISDANPLARLIEARLASDAASDIKKIFLWVQRDAYPLKKNALWPFNNQDVASAWRKSFSFYMEGKGESQTLMALSGQLDPQNQLMPFAPLLYCKTEKKFFHPPCPVCGQILQQCEDDALLQSAGLTPFSTSLVRYLHCPACKAPDFYSQEREPGALPHLKDRLALISGFGGLAKAQQAAAFPCAGCPLHEECYGTAGLASTRIVPFSFYPFYLMAFDASSLAATDFIALLSGASFQDAELLPERASEPGRVASINAVKQALTGQSPFLFDRDERHFLEILYLKLAFLGEVVQSIHSGGKFLHPDLKPGIESIWVKFPENSGWLPYFWNFQVDLLGVGIQESYTLPSRPTADAQFFAGLIWFYTLLANKRQTLSDVIAGIEKCAPENAGSLDQFLRQAVADPLNIFWDPQGKTMDNAWRGLWERSLQMGWLLLHAGMGQDNAAGEKFLGKLHDLRKDIRENLFLKERPIAVSARKPAQTALPKTEDEAISDILNGLIAKLQAMPTPKVDVRALKDVDTAVLPASEKPRKTPAPPVDDDTDEPVTETVVFSTHPSGKEAVAATIDKIRPMPPAAKAHQTSVESEETVMISVADMDRRPASKEKEPAVMEETMILSPQSLNKEAALPPADKTKQSPRAAEASQTSAESEETLILSVGDLDPQAQSNVKTPEKVLEETVIISSAAPVAKETHRKDGAARPEKAPSRDLMEETVILRPGEKSKDGIKK